MSENFIFSLVSFFLAQNTIMCTLVHFTVLYRLRGCHNRGMLRLLSDGNHLRGVDEMKTILSP